MIIGYPPKEIRQTNLQQVVKTIKRKTVANKQKANIEITRRKKSTTKRKARAEIQQVGTSFVAAFSPAKLPRYHYTYNDCQIEGHMFFKQSFETFNKETCILKMYHVCMIERGAKTYGEEGGERMGMKKLCKSCMIETATDMVITRV